MPDNRRCRRKPTLQEFIAFCVAETRKMVTDPEMHRVVPKVIAFAFISVSVALGAVWLAEYMFGPPAGFLAALLAVALAPEAMAKYADRLVRER